MKKKLKMLLVILSLLCLYSCKSSEEKTKEREEKMLDDYVEMLKKEFNLTLDKWEYYVKEENIEIAWVPGAFEIPLIAAKMAESKKYDAIICLGAVIRGNTSHYDYVCSEVTKGIATTSLKYGLPVMFGVLTTENIEQAIERAGTKAGNKDYDCALSAIEMVNLIKGLEQ